jgi:hypothetical protein
MKITKHLKNLEVDESLVGNVPDEMTKFFGEDGVQKIRTDERSEVRERVNRQAKAYSAFRTVKRNCKRLFAEKKAMNRQTSDDPVLFFQLIGNGAENIV